MDTVDVLEVFESIQGESSFAGLACFFIRLAGCNLDCSYCDTPESKGPGRAFPVEELVKRAAMSRAAIVEITGGEPLMQEGFRKLATRLRDGTGRRVLVETNGSCDISLVPEAVVAVVDVKTPGSGHPDSFDLGNLQRLRVYDEIKFVLTDRRDYEWSREFIGRHGLTSRSNPLFFSPVSSKLEPAKVGEWILDDGLPVRLQVQLHKFLGMK